MKGVQSPARGRPSKVTKPTAAPRGRPVRRPALSDTVPNQDPELEAHDAGALEVDHDPHQQEQHAQHQHHGDFDPEAAAAAAAAAAAQHQQEQQQQAQAQAQVQHQHQHQHQQQQLDLTAASILASSVQNPNEHPDLGGPHGVEDPNPAAPTPTEMLAQQSGYGAVVVESALAKRLAREPGMRLAQQRRPEQVLNLGRRSNVEALFAHIAGELAPVPCKNCHKGHGPWNACVVVDGQMCGSCANCWFNASGARCSFHETRNPQAHGGQVLGGDGIGFQMPAVPPAALAPFNFASVPASENPVVRFTVERAMAEMRAADKKTRYMLMVEAAARQLAFNIAQYEEAVQEEQDQHNQQQGAPPAVMDEQPAP
ncbi:hypothetical protein DL771_011704 [Monosporascus sp. 5C6A]|nr:hypothetical protein DL771_011704 [Monosporascus sp. 5C6A]